MSNNDRSHLTIMTNPTFITDDQQPPPYSAIYLNDDDNKSNRAFSSNLVFPPPSSISHGAYSQTHPVSYDELFQTSNSSNNFFSNLVQNINEMRARNNQPPIYEPSSTRAKSLEECLHSRFSKSYLKRHLQMVFVASILLIGLQMYLIEYKVRYSSIGSGIWAGSFNMLTFIIGITLLKSPKEWLLVVTIILHVFCIMFGLGGFIVINAIVVISPCYDSGDRQICSVNNYPFNVGLLILMLFLAALSMVAFTVYLVKLIKVFNSLHK